VRKLKKEDPERKGPGFNMINPVLPKQKRAIIQEESIATLEFTLQWSSMHASHTDCFFANKVNFRKDILPDEIVTALIGKRAEELLNLSGMTGPLVQPYDPECEFGINNSQFNGRYFSPAITGPHFGCFYPKGILRGLQDIFKGGTESFRCAGMDHNKILVDFNHPLSGENINLSVFIHDVRRKTGGPEGSCTDWMELITDGPGMQARLYGKPTDFFSDKPFLRADEHDDAIFHKESRLIPHIDKRAESIISGIYGNFLRDGMKALDLMSSWQSHIPGYIELDSLTGLGINDEEMSLNLQVNDRIVRDLNRTPSLPFSKGEFDAVVCTASVEYLTHPFEVFNDVSRILRPGGYFLITFSNRRGSPKVIGIWTELNEFERMGLVLEYFLQTGNFKNLATYSMRGLPRPVKDKYYRETPVSDPVYAVWGQSK
jgi:SAM-dependent methyltransferase